MHWRRGLRYAHVVQSIALLSVVPALAVEVCPCAACRRATRGSAAGEDRRACAGRRPFGGPEGWYRSFLEALARVGLVAGRTLVSDIGGVVSSEDQIAIESKRLVSRQPALILVWPGNVAAARAAKTRLAPSPSSSWQCPTRLSTDWWTAWRARAATSRASSVPTYDLTVKQLELLKEISPQVKGIVVIHGDLDRGERQTIARLRGAAA